MVDSSADEENARKLLNPFSVLAILFILLRFGLIRRILGRLFDYDNHALLEEKRETGQRPKELDNRKGGC